MTSPNSLSLARMKPEEWDMLMQRERELRSAAFVAARDGHPKHSRGAALREWWSCVSMILNACVQGSHGDKFDRSLPLDLFKIISNFAADMAVGNLPGPIRDVAERGRGGIGPREQRHIDIASAYIQAAKRGELVDRSPVKTVADAYGVARQTVQRWAKRDVSGHEFSARSLPARLEIAAKTYSEGGRGTVALNVRQGKRHTR